jgi:hypothetical protein
MTKRSEAFGRLLKAGIASIVNCEGKKAIIIEEELGQLTGVSGDSIQRYKSGYLPPEPEKIEVLATAAVQRGYLGREWLQRFLHAARYPFADKLLNQLYPIGPERPRPERVYNNLPAPTYSQFITREQAFAEVLDGLQQRSAAVLIVGLGGNGKTSLAREVATHCLQSENNTISFDSVVWISDKDRPGSTNLSTVLDEIARTLDYLGFTQFAHEEKLYEVRQLLKRQQVLLVVDNFETITDGALLTWLLRLPEPSKALITSREYNRAFRNSVIVSELRGMSEAEGLELIERRLHWLRIAQLVNDKTQLEPLIIATGGNPKAIEIALGLVKHERRPLQQVIDDLYAARGDLFDDLFARAWELLDQSARHILMVLTFFPTSASAEVLAATADVQGYIFDRAIDRILDLALIDEQRADLISEPRYTLHPLVRAFAQAQLAQQAEFEASARKRWVEWYFGLVRQVGWCWNDVQRLNLMDNDFETIFLIAHHLFAIKRYNETMEFVILARYYYYIRGYWDQRLELDMLQIQAAWALNNPLWEAEGLCTYVRLLSRQTRIQEASAHIQRLQELSQSLQIQGDVHYKILQALALYAAANDRLEDSERLWRFAIASEAATSSSLRVASRKWLGICLYTRGEIKEAEIILSEALNGAIAEQYEPAIVAISIQMTKLKLIQRDSSITYELLNSLMERAHAYHDRQGIADLHTIIARLHALRGNISAALAALTEAIDLFERLGMRRELAEARAELASLEAQLSTVVD